MQNELLQEMVDAVWAGMLIVRENQRIPGNRAQVKTTDGTLVTPTDKEVEQILHRRLSGIPGVRFVGEEGTTSGDDEGLTLLIDPLDGTRAFALNLATSTVIAATLNTNGRLTSCVIGEPSTGRIWLATDDTQTELRFIDEVTRLITAHYAVTVWPGELTSQASVLLDVSHGFSRSGRQIMTDRQVHRLMVGVASNAKLFMPGSNGLHFALVANGGQYAAGQITTAIGGPWDIAGALLVQQAGGQCRGFSMRDGQMAEKDPMLIQECDLMVSGNSPATVGRLVDLLYSSI